MNYNFIIILVSFYFNIYLVCSEINNVGDYDFHLNDPIIAAEIQKWRAIFRYFNLTQKILLPYVKT